MVRPPAVPARYAVNSAVMPGPGRYRYRLLEPVQARAWWARGPVDVRIRYPVTCEALARLLHLEAVPEVNREPITMAVGDAALVLRIAFPPKFRALAMKTYGGPEGLHRLIRDCELGLIERCG